ncbi:MAG: YraN family protein [Alphaproteobacteria bacterium]
MAAASKKQQAYRRGHTSEMLACLYLLCKGYRILARRMRNHCGEIDIIARRGNCLVAVEVKARAQFSDCAESITPHKQQRIARALQLWLAEHKIAGLSHASAPNIRFDVICITPRNWPTHIKDAFQC